MSIVARRVAHRSAGPEPRAPRLGPRAPAAALLYITTSILSKSLNKYRFTSYIIMHY